MLLVLMMPISNENDIRICLLGMGYVGLTSGAVYAKQGFKTICTDTIDSRVAGLWLA
jgi:UDP-glucose 6-dehydrogenase